jgi:glycosyltransferase involved in cell wall biosynthesis
VTGSLVQAGDVEALTEAMIRLGRDAALRIAYGDAGRARAVAEFGEAGMLERTADIYGEVLCSTSKR